MAGGGDRVTRQTANPNLLAPVSDMEFTERGHGTVTLCFVILLFYFIFRFSNLNSLASIMDAFHSDTDKTDDYLSKPTDGYHDTSAHVYMDQDMSTDGQWLNNTTDVYQSYWNAITDADTTDHQMTNDEYSVLFLALLAFNWTLGPFILTGNSLTIVIVVKYSREYRATMEEEILCNPSSGIT